MNSFQILLISVSICSLSIFQNIFALKHCGEFDNDDVVQRRLWNPFRKLSFEPELHRLLDGFQWGNTRKMNSALKSLEKVKTNESMDSFDDGIKSVPDRIRAEGYPCEVHSVVTRDGYILQLHRIPSSPRSASSNKTKTPVFLMHAFMESSNGWIVLGPENSLAYLLADAGYDVWMGNARGTTPSRGHVTLNSMGINQKDYWSYSWHEIGIYDLPASIDHILNETNHKKLQYIGFSQGTTSFLVLTSTHPEYNDKIIEANLLAPAAFMKNVRNPFYKAVSHFYQPLKLAFEALRIYKFDLNNNLLQRIAEFACRKVKNSTPLSCKFILSVIYSNQINCTSLRSILEFTPAGASVKQGIHYLQSIRSGEFRQFDYENKKHNQIVYGTTTPPSYNLSKITARINVFYSKGDTTATHENVKKLISRLPNVKFTYEVPVRNFEHVDFNYSRFVREALNDVLIDIIDNSTPKQ